MKVRINREIGLGRGGAEAVEEEEPKLSEEGLKREEIAQ